MCRSRSARRRHPTPMRRSPSMNIAACRSTMHSSTSACSGLRQPPAAPRYPDIPVLVISGELDNMTSPADGAAAAARFPRARHVVIANSFHVNALPHARSDCAAILVRRFMEQLETGDEGCAAAVPAVRLVPRFARHLRELTAAGGGARPEAGGGQG